MRMALGAAVALLIAWSSGVAAREKIAIPSITPKSLAEFLHRQGAPATVAGELYLPTQRTGAVPVLILKHGSGGLGGANGDAIRQWAQLVARWGVAALVVDSFGPLGITDTAANQAQLSSWADVADTLAALKLLGADARFDKRRIGVMGWSRGGSVALETALETVRTRIIADDLKFAAHVVFYGAAEFQYRDRATDRSPMLFFHGEADNYVPVGPTREFADWAQSMGNRVSFVAYPGTYHDFDVEGGFHGFARNLEVGAKCDLILDLTNGHVLRMDHKDNPGVGAEAVRGYVRSCFSRGANLAYNAAARAAAAEKLHAFLRQYLGATG